MRLFNRAPKALSSMDRNILGANRCFLTPDSDSVRGDNIRYSGFCPGEHAVFWGDRIRYDTGFRLRGAS